jgi:hypothetical protein
MSRFPGPGRTVFTVGTVAAVLAIACGRPSVVPTTDPGKGGAGAAAGGAGGGAGGAGGAAGGGGGAGRSPTDGPGFGVPRADAGPAVIPPEGSCAAEVHVPQRASVELLFVVDVSGSMAKAVAGSARTKWEMAREAVLGFVRDPGSAGLSAGLQFFPMRARCFTGICVGPNNPPGPTPPCPCPAGLTCAPTGRCSMTGGECMTAGPPCPGGAGADQCVATSMPCAGNPATCELDEYRKPAVPFGLLPGAAAMFTTAFAGQDPMNGASGTPTGPAVAGAIDQMRAHLAASAGRRGAVILVTDGEPTLCDPLTADAIAAPIAAARQLTPSVPTFVVGVFTAEDLTRGAGTVAERLAMAGGTMAFVIDPMQDLTRRLQDAFNQIRSLTVACEFTIPQPRSGMLDYGRVNVHVSGTNRDQDIPYVGSAARCDPTRGGWYYDVDPATGGRPSRVVVCDTTCKALQNDAAAKVDLRYGCKTVVIE